MKNILAVTALFCFAIFAAACGAPAANTTNSNSATKPAANAPASNAPANTATNTSTSEAPKTDAKTETADSVGVPECDEYIKKYEACLTSIASKAPAAAPGLKSAFEAQRNGFKQAASTPAGKSTLPGVCKQAIETAKTATSAYACTW